MPACRLCSTSGPTDPQTRLRSVDAVRGFALFGVLLVNMYNFGAYAPEWTGSVDRAFSTLMHSVFETKSWRLFSLLFGFGFALQLARVLSQDGGSLWFYFRRLLILFVFGMAHALFFDGDILMEYAALGLILVLFRNVGAVRCLFWPVFCWRLSRWAICSYTGEAAMIDCRWKMRCLSRSCRMDHPYLGSPMDVFEENAIAIPPQSGRICTARNQAWPSFRCFCWACTWAGPGFSTDPSRIFPGSEGYLAGVSASGESAHCLNGGCKHGLVMLFFGEHGI